MADLERIKNLSPEQLRLLKARLRAKKDAARKSSAPGEAPAPDATLPDAPRLAPPPLVAGPPRREAPLAFQQLRLWFLDQLESNSAFYNNPGVLSFPGPLDDARLRHALAELGRRQEVLRATIVPAHGEPVQRLAERWEPPLTVISLAALEPGLRRAEARRRAAADARRPFDLAAGPLARFTLLRLGPREHWLLFNLHHIIADAWAVRRLQAELLELYAALEAGRPPRLPELPLQYADFARWQRGWLRGAALERLLAAGQERLAGAPPLLELPTDRPRPHFQSFRGATLSAFFPADLAEALSRLGRQHRATLFVVLVAGLKALLTRLTEQRDLVIGAPMAYRDQAETANLIGFFANTLVLRTNLEGGPSFAEVLARVRQSSAMALEQQHLPFEKLVEVLQPQRSLSHSPIFQVAFSMLNLPGRRPAAESQSDRASGDAGGVRPEALEAGRGSTVYDLMFYAGENPGGISINLEYATDLFDATSMYRLLEHWRLLLAAAAADPQAPLAALPLMSPGERHQTLIEWNDSAVVPAEPLSTSALTARFAAQAARRPEAVAVIAAHPDEAAEERLTYGELDERANRLARHLQKLGAGSETRVGIAVERSLEMAVGILGIVKSGAAWVPLDPAYPAEHLEFLVADSGVTFLVTVAALRESLPGKGGELEVIELDTDAAVIARQGATAPPLALHPESAAYVIYTSGSTGRPKGIVVSQGAVANHMRWMGRRCPLGPGDAVLFQTALSFDAAVSDFFASLLDGATLVLLRPGGERDLSEVVETILRHDICALGMVSPVLAFLLAEPRFAECRSLRRVICGGEALAPELMDRFLAAFDGELINMYGPAEATIEATAWSCMAGRDVVPIGRPIDNARAVVVDPALRPRPIGIGGELCLGGCGLARGYLSRPGLTAERFVPDSTAGEPGQHLYRTGDLVRSLAGGELLFLGRIDDQVKVRGFRIELEEIEAVLARHEAVGSCAVVVAGEGERRRLAAWVTARDGQGIDESVLAAHLGRHLPAHMVPQSFGVLDELPLTPNQKVDRSALSRLVPEREEAAHEEPRGSAEQQMAEIWEELLGVARVGRNDDFFALGGHSLLATRVTSRLRRDLSVEVPVRALFEASTLAGFAAAVEKLERRLEGAELPPITPRPAGEGAPLSFAQQRLWFIDRFEPGSPAFNIPVALRFEGELDRAALGRAFERLAARQEAFRTTFPSRQGLPSQAIATPSPHPPIPLVDLTALPRKRREELALRLATREIRRGFDLESGPMWRVLLIALGAAEHALIAVVHHIIADGWSMGILVRELTAFYREARGGAAAGLAPLPVQYADFAVWQRQHLEPVLQRQLTWWRERLADLPELLELPTDRPRPELQSYHGGTVTRRFDEALTAGLKNLARKRRATPFMALLAAFGAALGRASGGAASVPPASEVAIGTVVAGRHRAEIEGLIGCFVNNLVLRLRLTTDEGDEGTAPSFADLLEQTRDVTLEAHANQDLPFERLVEELRPARRLGHSPLFQVMLAYQNTPGGTGGADGPEEATEGDSTAQLPDLRVRPMPVETGTTKFDLLLSADKVAGALSLVLNYRADLFDRTTASRWLEHLEQLTRAAVEEPEVHLEDLPLLSVATRQQVTWEAPATSAPAPAAGTPAPDVSPAELREIEGTVAEVWNAVLERDSTEPLPRDANFFDVGGQSLLLVQVHARLREAGHKLTMVDLFRHPTLGALATFLARAALPAVTATTPRPVLAGPVAAPAIQGERHVAIIGMAGRFPKAPNVDALWRLLVEGVEGVTFWSREDLKAAGADPRRLDDPDFVAARGVLEDADLYDARFFGDTPLEARLTDPQQRIFLECAWHALEDAGYVPGTSGTGAGYVPGTSGTGGGDPDTGRIGVFGGASLGTYVAHILSHPEIVRQVGQTQISLGNKIDYLATRVAYKLGLEGPAFTVQTACSTSLVAVHLACRSLLDGECEMALAGGVSIAAEQRQGYLYEPGGISSPDGHTRSYDAAADGTISGHGAGIVVLKRLSGALADGDTIRAVIRGSAINNDGAHKVGFTAPGVRGQTRVIHQALSRAGVDPATVGLVEGHGTATRLGDPIEVAALRQVWGDGAGPETCALGSIKSNFGHLDAAAGVAGLIKATLALERGMIPPSLHFTMPHPEIDYGPFFVPGEARPFPRGDEPRRAAVSSLGLGGTNAHLVLEEAPPVAPPEEDEAAPASAWRLLVLSARSVPALDEASRRLGTHLASFEGRSPDLADVAHTLAVGRRVFRHRRFLVARDTADAATAFGGLDAERLRDAEGEIRERPVVFLFPGGGAQYPGVGAELFRVHPAYREALERCHQLFERRLEVDLMRWLVPAENADLPALMAEQRRASIAMATIFTVSYAQAELLTSWGIHPRAMIGHSLGEYVAACRAGVLSLEEAVELVAARGRLFEELPPGSMLSVALGPEELASECGAALEQELAIAAVNTPSLSVVSGEPSAVAALGERLEARDVEIRALHVDYAAHSPMLEPILERFQAAAARVASRSPKIPHISATRGDWLGEEDAADPAAYWTRHLRRTVRFSDGLATLLRGFEAEEAPILLEVGPGRSLATLARQHPARGAAQVFTSMRVPGQEDSDVRVLLEALGQLWLNGGSFDWRAVLGPGCRRMPLPTYPFERQRHWIEPAASGPASAPPRTVAAPPSFEAAPPSAPTAPETSRRDSPRNALEERLAGVWRELIGVDRVGIHDDFFELGGSSLLAVRLGSRLRREMGIDLDLDVLLQASTVARLAERLKELGADEDGSVGEREKREFASVEEGPEALRCLVEIQAGEEGSELAPFIWIHAVGGHVYSYRSLARALDPSRPAWGLRARGLEPGEEPHESLEGMAAHYLEAVRHRRPEGPYILGGSSLGGVIAFEMARQLEAAGERVEFLALLDSPGPGQMPAEMADDDASIFAFLAGRQLAVENEELQGLDLETRFDFLIDAARGQGLLPGDVDVADVRRHLNVVRSLKRALFAYCPASYEGRVSFFRATERRPEDPPHPELAWIELAAAVEVRVVPGNHLTMHDPPHLDVLVKAMREAANQT